MQDFPQMAKGQTLIEEDDVKARSQTGDSVESDYEAQQGRCQESTAHQHIGVEETEDIGQIDKAVNPAPSLIFDVLAEIGHKYNTDKKIDTNITKLSCQMGTPETAAHGKIVESEQDDRKDSGKLMIGVHLFNAMEPFF